MSGKHHVTDAGTCPEPAEKQPPSWDFSIHSQERMVEQFPGLLTSREITSYREGRRRGVVWHMEILAMASRKCRELHSDAKLFAGYRDRYGADCCLYVSGDVVFVTVPGKTQGQKRVATVFSLSEKLASRISSRIRRGNSQPSKRNRRSHRGDIVYT